MATSNCPACVMYLLMRLSALSTTPWAWAVSQGLEAGDVLVSIDLYLHSHLFLVKILWLSADKADILSGEA